MTSVPDTHCTARSGYYGNLIRASHSTQKVEIPWLQAQTITYSVHSTVYVIVVSTLYWLECSPWEPHSSPSSHTDCSVSIKGETQMELTDANRLQKAVGSKYILQLIFLHLIKCCQCSYCMVFVRILQLAESLRRGWDKTIKASQRAPTTRGKLKTG